MWIEFHDTTPGHEKTFRLAEALDIPRAHAVGLLACLWSWARSNRKDGLFSSARAIEAAAVWDGEGGALVSALVACELLDERPGGGWFIHDWQDWGGRIATRNERAAKRMSDARRKDYLNLPDTCSQNVRAQNEIVRAQNPNVPEPCAHVMRLHDKTRQDMTGVVVGTSVACTTASAGEHVRAHVDTLAREAPTAPTTTPEKATPTTGEAPARISAEAKASLTEAVRAAGLSYADPMAVMRLVVTKLSSDPRTVPEAPALWAALPIDVRVAWVVEGLRRAVAAHPENPSARAPSMVRHVSKALESGIDLLAEKWAPGGAVVAFRPKDGPPASQSEALSESAQAAQAARVAEVKKMEARTPEERRADALRMLAMGVKAGGWTAARRAKLGELGASVADVDAILAGYAAESDALLPRGGQSPAP